MIINLMIWFKQLFCEHQFEYETVFVETYSYFDYGYGRDRLKTETRIIRTCKICGHHTDYKEI
jgi:hypothetical protein